jgi:plastocyanin
MKRVAWLILVGAALGACGSSSSGGGGGVPQTVTINDMTFSPTVVSTIPGGSVIVQNNSTLTHEFTSEAAETAGPPATVGNVSFDQTVAAGAKVTIPIPSNAVVGTHVWFYCKIHTTAMNQGYIQVVAPTGGGGY